MTLPSQKRLFYCIALRAPRRKPSTNPPFFNNGLCGTSYNFRQLLLRSPHIAQYVISLHIVDHVYYTSNLEGPVPGNTDEEVDDGEQYIGYKLANGQDISLDAPLVSGLHKNESRWLATDKFLPLCAPLLRNLRSLTILYDHSLYHLSGRVLITLLNLIQLPSLRHLHINCHQCPDIVINQVIGENVKHLVLKGHSENGALLRLPHQPLAPVYLDSLSINAGGFLSIFPACRVMTSRLRKLVIREFGMPHAIPSHAIRSLLQSCSATLQDFEIRWPNYDFDQNAFDLSELASLRRFSFSLILRAMDDSEMTQTLFLCLGKILRSSYSTSVSQQLEDISIHAYYVYHPTMLDILHWKNTFDTLLEDGFKNLRNLNIFVGGQSGCDKAVEMLEGSVYVKELRARRNLVVHIQVSADRVPSFAPDVRWDSYDSRRWE